MRGLELYFSQRPSFFSLPHLLPAVRNEEPGPRAGHSAQQEGKGQLPLETRLLHLREGGGRCPCCYGYCSVTDAEKGWRAK